MRPLSLTIEGFTAFRERQEIDFEPLELFVITGPTGAGKTSILDAIAFALYGEVPRIGSRKGTADVISLGTDRAAVEFEFRVGDTRPPPRRAPDLPSTRASPPRSSARRGPTGCRSRPAGVTEANEQIQELVGLDFDGFTRAVILPQGEFHRFLKGEAADRRKVLVLAARGLLLPADGGACPRQVRRPRGGRQTDRRPPPGALRRGDRGAPRGAPRRGRDRRLDASVDLRGARHRDRTGQRSLLRRAHGYSRSRPSRPGSPASAQTLRDSLASIREAEAAHDTAAKTAADVSVELDGARTSCERAETDLDTMCADVGTLEDIATATAAAITLRDTAAEERTAVDEIARATDATTHRPVTA